MDDETIQFMRHWWSRNEATFFPNRWLGVPCWQNPCDVWAVQEIISDTRPDVIVETGTFAGGSAVLWASLLAYCRRCDVTVECMRYALDLGQRALVVWGHTTVDSGGRQSGAGGAPVSSRVARPTA
jgi:cephalosporin hydroxylase